MRPGPRRGGQAMQARGGGRVVPSLLVVTAGTMAGTRLAARAGPILIGRAEDCTLVLDDDYASTRHARITQQGHEYFLEDLGLHQRHLPRPGQGDDADPVPLGVPIRIGRTVIELRP